MAVRLQQVLQALDAALFGTRVRVISVHVHGVVERLLLAAGVEVAQVGAGRLRFGRGGGNTGIKIESGGGGGDCAEEKERRIGALAGGGGRWWRGGGGWHEERM